MTSKTRVDNGAVKYQVRRAALDLGEFQIEDLRQATSLNISSIKTEVRRLRSEEAIEVGCKDGSPRRAGRPRSVYRFRDAEARLRVSAGLQPWLPRAAYVRPSSEPYLRAVAALDDITDIPETQRASSLWEAKELLDVAIDAEGGEYGPSSSQASLLFERARHAWLAQDYAAANFLLDRAKEIGGKAFVDAMDDKIQLVRAALVLEQIRAEMDVLSSATCGAPQMLLSQVIAKAAVHGVSAPLIELIYGVLKLFMKFAPNQGPVVPVAQQELIRNVVESGFVVDVAAKLFSQELDENLFDRHRPKPGWGNVQHGNVYALNIDSALD